MQSEITIDPVQLVARKGSVIYDLTLAELRVLALFIANKGRMVSRKEIHVAMRSACSKQFSNVPDVYVKYLRRKLGAEMIQTVRGQGYIFGGELEVAA